MYPKAYAGAKVTAEIQLQPLQCMQVIHAACNFAHTLMADLASQQHLMQQLLTMLGAAAARAAAPVNATARAQ